MRINSPPVCVSLTKAPLAAETQWCDDCRLGNNWKRILGGCRTLTLCMLNNRGSVFRFSWNAAQSGRIEWVTYGWWMGTKSDLVLWSWIFKSCYVLSDLLNEIWWVVNNRSWSWVISIKLFSKRLFWYINFYIIFYHRILSTLCEETNKNHHFFSLMMLVDVFRYPESTFRRLPPCSWQ